MKKPILFFLYLFSVCFFFNLEAREQFYQMPELFSVRHGLSSSKIVCIEQDKYGFIWIGTEDGLNKFDGVNFTVYRMDETDSTSLVSNHITALYVDSNERLWIGTIGGLQYYDEIKDRFVSVSLEQPDYVIRNNQCNDIYEDSRGNLWFSASKLGVLRYSAQTGESELFSPSHTRPDETLCSLHIRCIEEDTSGHIWFGSEDKGISIYDPFTGKFINLNTYNSDLPVNSVFDLCYLKNGFIMIATVGSGVGIYHKYTGRFYFPAKSGHVYSGMTGLSDHFSTTFSVVKTKPGELLIGTDGSGIYQMDPVTYSVYPYPLFTSLSVEGGNGKIHCLFEDRSGNVWVGMQNTGLCLLRKNVNGIKMFKKGSLLPFSLSNDFVSHITCDRQQNIWFATDGGGLNRYTPATGLFTHYHSSRFNPGSLPDEAVVSVFCDSKGRIWAGTYTGGLCLFQPETENFKIYQERPGKNSLPSNYVKTITEDQKGNLWIGTNGGGLSCFDPEKEYFENYSSKDYPELVSDYIVKLYIDSNNTLWIGTHFGLSRMDMATAYFRSYNHDPVLNTLSVHAIEKDESGNIWVGTTNGLKLYEETTDSFISHFPDNSNFNPVINGIISYKTHLWVSTNKEIICYSPHRKEVEWFSQSNDLNNIEFFQSSYYKSPEGDFYFGGNAGCCAFHPDNIQKNAFTPSVYLTGMKIFNDLVGIDKFVNERILLTKNLNETKCIVLKHSEKSFTIDFSAPDTPFPYSTIFSYWMEGFDRDWNILNSSQRSVTYTNFSPGVYTFHIRATSIPGTWSDSKKSLVIEILPPLWATWWAMSLYVFATLSIIIMILRFAFLRVKDKNELKIERLKVKQQEELSKSKMQFFTNISHEFRTPLTLIMGPLEQMQSVEKDPEKNRVYQMILRNVNRLLLLIDQILDLRKIEMGKMQIMAQCIDLVTFVGESLELFADLARMKNISLSFNYEPDHINIWFDPDMLDKCMRNLLSNAFKFTPEGGTVRVTLSQPDSRNVVIKVEDTGCGIAPENLDKIFERFYRGEKERTTSGTGIGLHLVKCILEQHKASIHVKSILGKGTTFIIRIKSGKEHLNPEEYTEKPVNLPVIQNPGIKIENVFSDPSIISEEKQIVLLVEDEEDMRRYIKSELDPFYNVIEATNAKEAFMILKERIPDIIVTDVMMPHISGIELCKKVKENMATCHIPVIILTALGDMEHRISGLETGADSYIAKPFQSRYLLIRIEKLLELRKKMTERFRRMLDLEPQEINVSNPDEVLFRKAIDYIRDHMENPQLTVVDMSKALSISRTSMHRRIKIVSGMSPVELIKEVRMKQAAYLLSTGNLTISEVAFRVGYNSLSYFSSSFGSYFGETPKEYMKKHIIS